LLILYNILEICVGEYSKSRAEKQKFSFLEKKEETWKEALSVLLKSVKSEDHADFRKRWSDIQGNLSFKPMRWGVKNQVSQNKYSRTIFYLCPHKQRSHDSNGLEVEGNTKVERQ